MPSKISNKLYFSLCIETKKSKQPICSCLLLNVLFENYSMQDISNARYIQCKIYPMQDLSNARFIQCKIYSMQDISNARYIQCEVYPMQDIFYARYIQCKIYPVRAIPMRARGLVLSKNAHPFSFKVGGKELGAHALV